MIIIPTIKKLEDFIYKEFSALMADDVDSGQVEELAEELYKFIKKNVSKYKKPASGASIGGGGDRPKT